MQGSAGCAVEADEICDFSPFLFVARGDACRLVEVPSVSLAPPHREPPPDQPIAPSKSKPDVHSGSWEQPFASIRSASTMAARRSQCVCTTRLRRIKRADGGAGSTSRSSSTRRRSPTMSPPSRRLAPARRRCCRPPSSSGRAAATTTTTTCSARRRSPAGASSSA